MTDVLNSASLLATTRGYMPIDVHAEKMHFSKKLQTEMHADHAGTSAKICAHSICENQREEFDVKESLGSA